MGPMAGHAAAKRRRGIQVAISSQFHNFPEAIAQADPCPSRVRPHEETRSPSPSEEDVESESDCPRY